jgi:predicted aminopeptidase
MNNTFIKCVLLSTGLLSINCCYLAKQGYYAAKYSFNAKKIDKVIQEKRCDAGEKEFLRNVRSIKKYSVEKVGLVDNSNYTRYVRIDKGYLIDLVGASKPDTFALHEWWFPFFGKAPFLGYFKTNDAVHEAKKFKKKGYDVVIESIDAFSTLGIVSDPVYSFMKKLSIYRLAYLIIHEQTHTTIFLQHQLNFNEELATFVGDVGAFSYIRERFGDTSVEYRKALLEKQDGDAWEQQIRDLHASLDSIYSGTMSREQKLHRKTIVIDSFKITLSNNYSDLFKTDLYKGVKKAAINNAFLSIFMTYYKELSLFYDLYDKKNNDLKATVEEFLRSQLSGTGTGRS